MDTMEMVLWSATIVEQEEQENGKTKEKRRPYLVYALDPTQVISIVTDEYKGTGARWKITGIKISNIVDVLNFTGVQDISVSSGYAGSGRVNS